MTQEKTVRRLRLSFEDTDLTAVREYLEEMAASGWQLSEIGRHYTFRKAPPQTRQYAVELLGGGDWHDTLTVSETVRRFIDTHERAGWHYVCHRGRLFVFYAGNPQAAPVSVNAAAQLHDIAAATRTRRLYDLLFPLLLTVLFFVWLKLQPLFFITTYTGIALVPLLLFSVVSGIVMFVRFLRWHRHAKREVAIGRPLPYYTLAKCRKRYRLRNILQLVFFSLFAVLLTLDLAGTSRSVRLQATICALLIITLILFAHWVQQSALDDATNVGLLLIVGFVCVLAISSSNSLAVLTDKPACIETPVYSSADQPALSGHTIPVTLRHFGSPVSSYTNTVTGSSTVLASSYTYASQNETEALHYQLFFSPLSLLRTGFQHYAAQNQVLTPEDPAPWGAVAAWRTADNRYLVDYGELLLCLDYAPDNDTAPASVFAAAFGTTTTTKVHS